MGGKYTKSFEKLGYNIKIKKGNLLERKNLRLRTEAVDPSFLREKVAYDICNVIGLPSLSLNYARVFFNDKYMGLYALRDAFKAQWIEYTFGEKNTKHLYTCDGQYMTEETENLYNCINDDENIKDDPDWKHFIERLKAVKTRADLEEFFDVKTFIKWQVIKYLFGSWDHDTTGHNQVVYMYHDTSSEKDKWIPMLYDFDSDFGAYRDHKTRRSFSEETREALSPFYKLLQLNDKNEELISYIDEFMRKGFNPKDLIPRIDQLKEFLSPYVKEDRTPDENGRLPGRQERVNIKIEDYFTYDDFNDNSEFTTIRLNKYTSETTYNSEEIMGLKQWIIERFQFVCEFYELDCSYAEEYLKDVSYEVDLRSYDEKNGGCHNSGYNCCILTKSVKLIDNVGQWGVENGEWCLFEEDIENNNCWAITEGYPCCKNKNTQVQDISSDGRKWGFENDDWCGIIEEKEDDNQERQCPVNSEYSCCSSCDVYYVDEFEWGVEDGSWCLTPFKCTPTTTIISETESTVEPSIFTLPDDITTEIIEPTETGIEPSIFTTLDEATVTEIIKSTEASSEIETEVSDISDGESEIDIYETDIEVASSSSSEESDEDSVEEKESTTDITNESEIEVDYEISEAEAVTEISENEAETETESKVDDEIRKTEGAVKIIENETEIGIADEISDTEIEIDNEFNETEPIIDDIHSEEEITENSSNEEDISSKVTIISTNDTTIVKFPMTYLIDSEVETDTVVTNEEDTEKVDNDENSVEETSVEITSEKITISRTTTIIKNTETAEALETEVNSEVDEEEIMDEVEILTIETDAITDVEELNSESDEDNVDN